MRNVCQKNSMWTSSRTRSQRVSQIGGVDVTYVPDQDAVLLAKVGDVVCVESRSSAADRQANFSGTVMAVHDAEDGVYGLTNLSYIADRPGLVATSPAVFLASA